MLGKEDALVSLRFSSSLVLLCSLVQVLSISNTFFQTIHNYSQNSIYQEAQSAKICDTMGSGMMGYASVQCDVDR